MLKLFNIFMDIQLEISIYILISGFLSSIVRIFSGMKNGCFYAKGNFPYPKILEKYINNIHFIETPFWYCHFGFQFLLCLCIYRLSHLGEGATGYGISLFAAYLTAIGSSSIAGTFYQGYINVASGKEFIDTTENPKSEFALGNISFWWKRPWKGKLRVYASVLGLISLISGIYLGLFY